MSIIESTPPGANLPVPPEPPRRYVWEDQETLVERRRKRLRYRLSRFFGSNWLRLTVLILIVAALFNADLMRALRTFWEAAAPFVLRLVTVATLIIGQFALMFWFLGRARMYTIWPGTEGVSFRDYRGQPELLEQAKQIVKLLRGVRVFEEAGGEPLNGLLLEGPPGTGKTWLAQAISTEAGVPFFYVDASSMNSMFVGIAPLKVGNIYRKARRAAKEYGASVIFIDEIDAIGSRAGVAQVDKDGASVNDETAYRKGVWTKLPIIFGMGAGSGMLSTLLIEMSGFSLEHGWWARKKRAFYKTILRRNPPKPNKRVLTIGATNRIGALDPALLRPGRFDKKIRVDAPDLEGRRDIIAYYLSKMAHDETIDPLILASETPFYTPADLKYLLNEALRYALFENRLYMTITDVRRAQPEHEMGLRSPIKNLAVEDKYRLAAHEAGHAIAIRIYRPHYRISRITVIRQGQALGHVMSYPATESYEVLKTYESLTNDLRVSVAGKAGEMEYCGEGEQTLGVGGDFQSIRYNLRRMADAGMFGPMGMGTTFAPMQGATLTGSTDAGINKDVSEAMEEAFRQALEDVRMMMRLHRPMGEALIALLLEKDELLADEVEAFFDQYGFYTPKVRLNENVDQPDVVITPESS
ncbi:MAG: AAA family ATPase [bacterium]|nr:AAA family ATPase [bacterium]